MAASNLDSKGQVKQNAAVTLSAKNSIQLKEAFSVPASANLKLRIEDCSLD